MKLKKIIFLISISLSLNAIDLDGSELNKLIDKSNQEHKPLFIFISANNCKFCDKEIEVLKNNQTIMDIVDDAFDSFHINQDIEYEETLSVPVTPALLFYDKNNNEIVRYYGFQSESELLEIITDPMLFKEVKKNNEESN